MGVEQLVRQVIVPVASTYAVLVGILLLYRRDRRRGAGTNVRRPGLFRRWLGAPRPPGEQPSWRELVRYLADAAVGGYALFLVIVVVFYFVLGGQSRAFIREALVEGSALAFLIVPAGLLLITWIHERGRRG